jgi:hypothetical protein
MQGAMLFCFINSPEQVRASLITTCRGMRFSEKALDILRVFGPLYTERRIPTTKSNPFCGPDPTQPPHLSVHGTTVHAEESEILSMYTGVVCAVRPCYSHSALPVKICSRLGCHTPFLAIGDPKYSGQQ